jgi:GNAT superfamily N-acetyltransferase
METAVKIEMTATPQTFWVRPACTDDFTGMIRLLQESSAIEAKFEFDREKQRRGLQLLLESPSASIWVAERRGRVVGMVTVQLVVSTAEGRFSGVVEDLFVSSAYRRRGIGKALLKAAVQWAHSGGAARVQLLADGHNVPALIFYRKQDWKQTSMMAIRRSI